MGKRDQDRSQHLALAKAKAKKAGANVPASLVNAASDYDKAAKRQKQRDRRTKRLDDLLEEPSIPSFLDQLEIIDQVESLLSKLSERDRAALTLHHLLRLSRSEVGHILGVNAETAGELVRSARERARSRECFPKPPDF